MTRRWPLVLCELLNTDDEWEIQSLYRRISVPSLSSPPPLNFARSRDTPSLACREKGALSLKDKVCKASLTAPLR